MLQIRTVVLLTWLAAHAVRAVNECVANSGVCDAGGQSCGDPDDNVSGDWFCACTGNTVGKQERGLATCTLPQIPEPTVSQEDDDGLSDEAIAILIALASVIFLSLLVFLCWMLLRRPAQATRKAPPVQIPPVQTELIDTDDSDAEGLPTARGEREKRDAAQEHQKTRNEMIEMIKLIRAQETIERCDRSERSERRRERRERRRERRRRRREKRRQRRELEAADSFDDWSSEGESLSMSRTSSLQGGTLRSHSSSMFASDFPYAAQESSSNLRSTLLSENNKSRNVVRVVAPDDALVCSPPSEISPRYVFSSPPRPQPQPAGLFSPGQAVGLFAAGQPAGLYSPSRFSSARSVGQLSAYQPPNPHSSFAASVPHYSVHDPFDDTARSQVTETGSVVSQSDPAFHRVSGLEPAFPSRFTHEATASWSPAAAVNHSTAYGPQPRRVPLPVPGEEPLSRRSSAAWSMDPPLQVLDYTRAPVDRPVFRNQQSHPLMWSST